MVWSPILMVANNVGVSWENIVLIVLLLGSLVMYAKDFKLGVIIDIIITAGLVVGFYIGGYNYVSSLVVFFLMIIILSLSIYTTNRFASAGGLI